MSINFCLVILSFLLADCELFDFVRSHKHDFSEKVFYINFPAIPPFPHILYSFSNIDNLECENDKFEID